MSLARRLNPRIEEWMIILDNRPHHVMHAPQANLHQKTQKITYMTKTIIGIC